MHVFYIMSHIRLIRSLIRAVIKGFVLNLICLTENYRYIFYQKSICMRKTTAQVGSKIEKPFTLPLLQYGFEQITYLGT